MDKGKKFKNIHDKLATILGVFSPGERLSAGEIAKRIEKRGYKVEESNLRPFIYHRMLHKYLRKEKEGGRNLYMPVV